MLVAQLFSRRGFFSADDAFGESFCAGSEEGGHSIVFAEGFADGGSGCRGE
jgi:hypothetical protein